MPASNSEAALQEDVDVDMNGSTSSSSSSSSGVQNGSSSHVSQSAESELFPKEESFSEMGAIFDWNWLQLFVIIT